MRSNAKRALFKDATLTNVILDKANLYKANFLSAKTVQTELSSALSIQDAMAHNGGSLHDTSLINYSHADCNISLSDSWKLKTGIVSAAKLTTESSGCRFVLHSYKTEANMFQHIDLFNKWDAGCWPYSRAVLRAEKSEGVRIELRGINNNGSVIACDTIGKSY